jgi:protein-tyrosine phosphatase
MSAKFSVLFVCMGNICRSPTAHGVFQHKVNKMGLQDKIIVDSAGTLDYHTGSPPDERAQLHASHRGYDLSDLRARQIKPIDFSTFDLIAVMDWDNLSFVQDMCPAESKARVHRLTEFCTRHQADVVPDPYYGGTQGFDHVLDLVEDACEGLMAHIQKQANH